VSMAEAAAKNAASKTVHVRYGFVDGEAVSHSQSASEECGRPMRREANCVVCVFCGESKCG